VLATSPLSWTGDNAFCLVGYSLGGGIAASFTEMFPTVVKALVLIAPAGIIREHHNLRTKQMFALTSPWMPEGTWKYLLHKRTGTTPMSLPAALGSGDPDEGTNPDAAVEEIIKGEANEEAGKEVVDSIKWQIDTNHGFIKAFISSVRFGPTSGETDTWRNIGARLTEQQSKKDDVEAQRKGLVGGKILVMMGNKDSIILRNEVEPDLKAAFGRQNVKMAIFEAGHDLPVQMPGKVTEKIWETWKELGVVL
jgi:pimeloyl-ACP methyl ester carboxylesterase